jgi:hypothetical protein
MGLGTSEWIALFILGAGVLMATFGHWVARIIGFVVMVLAVAGLLYGRAPAPPEPRVYTDKTEADFVKLCSGHTQTQCEAYIADDKGKWLPVEGQITNIFESGMVSLSTAQGTVSCVVTPSLKPRLPAYNIGDKAKMAGRVDYVFMNTLALSDCEFR